MAESRAGNNSPWWRCADGWPMEPLDALHFWFPNRGKDPLGDNVCFHPEPYHFPSLLALLPEQGELFLPDELIDLVMILIVLCVLVTVGIIAAKYAWDFLDPSFRAIHPEHKKWYVVANMSKSLFLAVLCFSSRYWVGTYRLFYYDRWQQRVEIKRSMAIYVATDVVALCLVPKLPVSTVIHHVTTALLTVVVSAVNLDVPGHAGILGPSKMLVLYGICSTVSYLVNAYLALRVVYPKAGWLKVLCKLSLATYLVCCGFNWTIQGMYITGFWWDRDYSLYTLLYPLLIATIVHDDIVLMRWLFRQSSPMADNAKHKKL